MSLKLCFIGAGNLATHLSTALQNAGFEIKQFYSRTEFSAKTLATQLNTQYTTQKSALTKDADIYFVALKDSVIGEVLAGIDFGDKLVVHCSGSMPLSVLRPFSENTGVIYPLQTFSKNRNVDFADIPVFIEANTKQNEKRLIELVSKISNKVNVLDSEKRKSLHISGVFACNFVNHFYKLAADFLQTENISFDVLHPLIIETAKKATEMHPGLAQTGPALRFDETILNEHLNQLSENPEMKELYNSISRSIFEHHQKK